MDKRRITIFPEALDQICRLCLKDDCTSNIFLGTLAKNGKKYIDLISVLSGAQVQENDGLPSKICNTCANKLYDFYMYKQQIETTQVLLRIALGKVIVQPAKQSESSEHSLQIENKNLNIQNEVITIDDDDEDNETNFGYKNASLSVEKENVQEINLNKNPNEIDRQTILSVCKNSTEGSILNNNLSNKETQNIEDVMECWKKNYSCISCNSNLNTHPELKFYSFPLETKRCNDWKRALKLDKIEPISPITLHKNVYLCDRHFTPSMFYGKNKLRKTAVPIDFTEDPRSKLKVTVQTENENHISDINEDKNPTDLVCNESLDLSDDDDDDVVPIAIVDHSYSKKITKTKNKEKEVNKVKVKKVKEVKKETPESTRFQCISFDEKGNQIYTCCFCSETFEDRLMYKKHKFKEYKKRRGKPNTRIACSVCGKLIRRVRIKDHMVLHGKERPYVCDICGKRYRSSSNLYDHRLTHKKIKNKVCEICGKSFYYACKLQLHLQTHNTKPEPNPNFMCRICGYTCSTKQSLKKHEDNHLLEKKGLRKVRNRAYSMRKSIKLTEKKTECDICHKKFRFHSHVIIHMRTHTGERPFKCQYCSKYFRQQGQLDYHELLHTRVKAYECSFCGKKFTLNGTLQQHIKIHTGDKPHQCDLCDKRFYTSSAVRKHKNIHENNLGLKPS
ncbi:unnamed protein product [Psylliodes chrysocephalus]|uniref:Uncharacterized protein n=1 Tax=Psylliodes chrysocephalus TaxID=3402493 RepID=A0A9P0G8U7_9CUCU|nr:unnamed protein product [Psylliodes chrysocephala]